MSDGRPNQVRPAVPTSASAYDFARLLSRSLTSLNLDRTAQTDGSLVEDENEPVDSTATDDDHSRQREWSVKQQTKQVEFLDSLVLLLDVFVYIEISAVYYADCSTIRFLIRALPQWVLLTPKPPQLVTPPIRGPSVPLILLTNLFIIFSHLLSSAPHGSESVRGYLHGGLLMDFVGELGPVSKIRLLLLDLWILILQLVLLAVLTKEKRLKASLVKRVRRRSNRRASPPQLPEISQDLDAEERGVRRSQDGLRELEDALPSTLENEQSVPAHPCDAFYSGQQVVAHITLADLYGEIKLWKQGNG